MNILHISNSFPNSRVYTELVHHLGELGVNQTIYSAVRTQKEAAFDPPELSCLKTDFKNILHPYDRIFYRNKIRKIYKDVIKRNDLKNVDLVHAHTLYSDGGVALKIKKKKHGVPYLVAVRSTDLNSFQKKRPDLRLKRNKILREAEKVIFISPAHRKKFLALLKNPLKTEVFDKTVTIPNGLDPFFIEHASIQNVRQSTLKLLYVGDFRKLKNISTLIKAVHFLNKDKNVDAELTIVGNGGTEEAKIKQILNTGKYPYIKYLGMITERKSLRKIYAEHDIFVMISKPETFGLVYIEALSQGLPIIYTKGEGVDGYFESEAQFAYAVEDPQNINKIAQKIIDASLQLDTKLKKTCIEQAQQFNWTNVAAIYKNIYTDLTGEI